MIKAYDGDSVTDVYEVFKGDKFVCSTGSRESVCILSLFCCAVLGILAHQIWTSIV